MNIFDQYVEAAKAARDMARVLEKIEKELDAYEFPAYWLVKNLRDILAEVKYK